MNKKSIDSAKFRHSGIKHVLFSLMLIICCSSEQEQVAIISIPAIPDGVVALLAQSSIGDRMGEVITIPISGQTALRFGIDVPREQSAPLVITLSGMSDDGCRAAEGTAELTLVGATFPIERTIPLALLNARRCTLSVSVRAGSGRVRSDPPGIDCSEQGGTCSLEYAPDGTAVMQLIAETDPQSYALWSQSCLGSAPCNVTLNRENAVDVTFSPRECSVDKVCFYSPLPRSVSYTSLWTLSSDDTWAVGGLADGKVAHYQEGRWVMIPSGVKTTLRSVWGSSPTNVWAVGDGGVAVRWDGTSFTKVATGITTALYAVFGTGDSDVWAVGDSSVTLHYDGNSFTRFVTPLTKATRLTAGWGLLPNDIWAVGFAGTVLRWNGSTWGLAMAPDPSANSVSIFGTRADDVWLVAGRRAWRWNGTAWNQGLQDSAALLQGFARSANDVWLLRAGQQVQSYDGSGFTRDQVPTIGSSLVTLAAAGTTDVWTAGTDGEIDRGSNGVWTQSIGFTYSQNLGRLSNLFGTSANDIWVAGAFTTMHWDGNSWSLNGPDLIDSYALFGSASDDIWDLGNRGEVFHYDGQSWTQQTTVSGAVFVGGVAISKTLAYAVGTGGPVFRYNGTSWSRDATAPPGLTLRSIWASAPTDLWAVGSSGAIARGTGSSWTTVTPPTTATFYAVSGSSAQNVFLVGQEIWRYNGVGYVKDTKPGTGNLTAVYALPDGTAWAVSDTGNVLRWDGTQWDLLDTAQAQNLLGVLPISSSDVWFVGDRSVILRYRP